MLEMHAKGLWLLGGYFMSINLLANKAADVGHKHQIGLQNGWKGLKSEISG